MNNQSLLQLVNEAIEFPGDIRILYQIKNELIENIRTETLKNLGTKTSDITIIKRILKSVPDYSERLKYAHKFEFEGNTYFGFTESHYMIACNNNMQFEESKDDLKLDLSRIINPSMFEDCIEFIVDMVDLKLFCKTHKRSDKAPYIITYDKDKKIGLNAYYLLDVLNFNDTNKINIKDSLKPVAVRNKDKKTLGLILSIRIK